MDFLNNIFQFWNTYGWPGIAIIVFLVIGYVGVKYMDKKADIRSNKMTSDLSNNIVSAFKEMEKERLLHDKEIERELISTINNTISKTIDNHYVLEQESHKISEAHRTDITIDVSDKLWDMLQTFNSQRVTIMELHNGGINLNGLSFLRYDITHEKQEKGVLPINGNVQSLPVSNIEIVYRDILASKNSVVIYHQKDIEELYDRGATVLYSDLRDKLNVEHIIYSGIYNDDNILYALICLEYQAGYKYPNIVDEVKIAQYTSEISQLYKYVKKY